MCAFAMNEDGANKLSSASPVSKFLDPLLETRAELHAGVQGCSRPFTLTSLAEEEEAKPERKRPCDSPIKLKTTVRPVVMSAVLLTASSVNGCERNRQRTILCFPVRPQLQYWAADDILFFSVASRFGVLPVSKPYCAKGAVRPQSVNHS